MERTNVPRIVTHMASGYWSKRCCHTQQLIKGRFEQRPWAPAQEVLPPDSYPKSPNKFTQP